MRLACYRPEKRHNLIAEGPLFELAESYRPPLAPSIPSIQSLHTISIPFSYCPSRTKNERRGQIKHTNQEPGRLTPFSHHVHHRTSRGRANHQWIQSTTQSSLLLRLRCRQFRIHLRPSHEAASHTNRPQPDIEHRTVQEDGNLRKFSFRALTALPSKRNSTVEQPRQVANPVTFSSSYTFT